MNKFTITLDTTPPIIEIYAPSYTTSASTDEIRVVANEPLADYQDIYITDINGVRNNVIFSQVLDTQGNIVGFKGNVPFNTYPLGYAIIHAKLKDSVYNDSLSVTRTIDIKQGVELNLTLQEFYQDVAITQTIRELDIIEKSRDMVYKEVIVNLERREKSQQLETTEATMQMDLSIVKIK